jgi:hypothetical protein
MRGLNRRRLLTVVLAPAAALGSTALAVSIVCPSWLADGSCPVALIGLHFVTASGGDRWFCRDAAAAAQRRHEARPEAGERSGAMSAWPASRQESGSTATPLDPSRAVSARP